MDAGVAESGVGASDRARHRLQHLVELALAERLVERRRRALGYHDAQRDVGRHVRRPAGDSDHRARGIGGTHGLDDLRHRQVLEDLAVGAQRCNPQYTTLNTNAAGRELLRQSLSNVTTNQLNSPETTSVAAFGQLNWHLNERSTFTLGLRQR